MCWHAKERNGVLCARLGAHTMLGYSSKCGSSMRSGGQLQLMILSLMYLRLTTTVAELAFTLRHKTIIKSELGTFLGVLSLEHNNAQFPGVTFC